MSEAGRFPETDVLRAMADHVVMLPLAAVLAGWRDGDERGWQAEFDMLRSERTTRIDMLASSIQTDGIRLPILLGSDGRVWDGHHRLCAADLLALATVPCEFADPGAVAVRGEVTAVEYGVANTSGSVCGIWAECDRSTAERVLATRPGDRLVERRRIQYRHRVTEWTDVVSRPGQQAPK